MGAQSEMIVEIYRIFKEKTGVFSDREAEIIAAAFEQKDNLATRNDAVGRQGRPPKRGERVSKRILPICGWRRQKAFMPSIPS